MCCGETVCFDLCLPCYFGFVWRLFYCCFVLGLVLVYDALLMGLGCLCMHVGAWVAGLLVVSVCCLFV